MFLRPFGLYRNAYEPNIPPHSVTVQNMPPNTYHAHDNICEPLQVISVKVQVITP